LNSKPLNCSLDGMRRSFARK